MIHYYRERQVIITDNIFDNLTTSRQLNIIKSALPYIPLNIRRNVSLLVKLTELKNTFTLFDNKNEYTMGICSENSEGNVVEMMNSIKPFCTKKEIETMDFAYNIFAAYHLSQNDSSTDNLSFLKAMLSPEQLAIFNSYKSLLGLEK